MFFVMTRKKHINIIKKGFPLYSVTQEVRVESPSHVNYILYFCTIPTFNLHKTKFLMDIMYNYLEELFYDIIENNI